MDDIVTFDSEFVEVARRGKVENNNLGRLRAIYNSLSRSLEGLGFYSLHWSDTA